MHTMTVPLVCTLGQTWQVIPEIYGFLDPERCPLYAAAPNIAERRRMLPALPPPTALWVVTTASTRGQDRLLDWWRRLGAPVPLRLWRTAADDTTAQVEVDLIRELIHRAVFHAGPSAILCLAGGRKTMSADMQRAGMVYGCQAMLHVLAPEGEAGKRLNDCDFAQPLPPELASLIQPVYIGRASRADLIGLPPAITADAYPLPADDRPFVADGRWLSRDISQREVDSANLLVQFHADLARSEPHENWRSLYRLPPALIQRLRDTPLTAVPRDWLISLPKADLHCHIGGILDLDEQVAVGRAVWDLLDGQARAQAQRDAEQWWSQTAQPGGQRWGNLDPGRRARASACLLATYDPEDLRAALWPPGLARIALKARHRWGFAAYEHPGSLVGSTILQTPEAVYATARALLDRCQRDGLAYLELRCSPAKYVRGFLELMHAALGADHTTVVRIILIADRRDEDRDPERIRSTVRMALDARERLDGRVVGLDLAGDEQRGDPASIAPLFQDAFAACLRITIHAGEGEPAENIWKAAYHLHADRIGHGLSLADAPQLSQRFRDRRICLELCPTSNREVVGFRDPMVRESADCPGYPLRQLMKHGVPLTLCTDNPGISRTTLADEYLTAARMSELSVWESLALMKQAFLHAFLPAEQREILIKRLDPCIAAAAQACFGQERMS